MCECVSLIMYVCVFLSVCLSARVAQVVERGACNARVVGLIPTGDQKIISIK